MNFRAGSILINLISIISLFAAIALTLASMMIPEWEVAILSQVGQIHYFGLYHTCTYGNRQGPMGQGSWACTLIPYGKQMGQEWMNWHIQQPGLSAASMETNYYVEGGECK